MEHDTIIADALLSAKDIFKEINFQKITSDDFKKFCIVNR